MKKKLAKLFLLALVSLQLLACNDVLLVDDGFNSSAPFATQEELLEVQSQSDNYVNYKVARTLGMIKLQQFEGFNEFSPAAVLSERPVIIWKNSKTPMYYEFHVKENGKDVGYVTCNIDKTKGDSVVYIGKQSNRYSNKTNRSVCSNSSKIYCGDYPYYEVRSTSARALAEEEEEEELSDYEEYLLYLDSLTDEEWELFETTKEDALIELEKIKKEEDERIAKLWELIDLAEQNLLDLTDEEITGILEGTSARSIKKEYDVYENAVSRTRFIFIEPYCNSDDNKKRTYRLLTQCVPTVIEFIARRYNEDKNLGLTEEQIANIIYQHTQNDGNMLGVSLNWNKALGASTYNKLSFTHELPINTFNKIHDQLAIWKLPVVLNRHGIKSSVNATHLERLSSLGHARLVVGTAIEENYTQKKFWFINWSQWEGNNSYYYMWDNGYENSKGYFSKPPKGSNYSYSDCYFWEKNNTWYYRSVKCVRPFGTIEGGIALKESEKYL